MGLEVVLLGGLLAVAGVAGLAGVAAHQGLHSDGDMLSGHVSGDLQGDLAPSGQEAGDLSDIETDDDTLR